MFKSRGGEPQFQSHTQAFELMDAGLEKSLSWGDWKNVAAQAVNLSDVCIARGDLKQAFEHGRTAFAFAYKAGVAHLFIMASATIATVLHYQGLRAEAAAGFEDAERYQKKLQPEYPLLYSHSGSQICEWMLDEGREGEVLSRALQTLKWVEAQGWLADIAADHLSLGRAYSIRVRHGIEDSLTDATTHLGQALDGFRRAGYQDCLPLGLLARAALHTHTRAFDLAGKDLDEALRIAERCGFRLHEADAHLGYASLALAEDDPTAALDHLATARKIVDEIGYHRRDGELAELEAQAREMAEAAPPPTAALARVPSPPPPAPTPTKPMPEAPATQHVDVGIVIALPEEVREVLALAGSYARHPAADLDTYLFTRGAYRCAVTLVGEMGETQAGMFTERLIATLDPGIVLSMGIAGGLNDLMAGDVHVPSQAAQYIQDAKAAPTAGGGFSVVPGAPAYRADFALLKAVRAFEFDHPAAHKQWVANGAADLAELLPDAAKRAALVAEKQVRGDVRLLTDGHVATGPVVGAAVPLLLEPDGPVAVLRTRPGAPSCRSALAGTTAASRRPRC